MDATDIKLIVFSFIFFLVINYVIGRSDEKKIIISDDPYNAQIRYDLYMRHKFKTNFLRAIIFALGVFAFLHVVKYKGSPQLNRPDVKSMFVAIPF